MLAELAGYIISIYQQNLQDYRKIVVAMQEFGICLDDYDKDKSPNSNLLIPESDDLAQKLEEFSAYRGDIIASIRERESIASELQSMICKETGIASFDAVYLNPHLDETMLNEIRYLTEAIKGEINQILTMDKSIIPRLKMEVETVKLELHRLQSAKKTKNIYENQGSIEARFIDKKK